MVAGIVGPASPIEGNRRARRLLAAAAGLLLLAPAVAAEERRDPTRDAAPAPAHSRSSAFSRVRSAPSPAVSRRSTPAVSSPSAAADGNRALVIESGPVIFGEVLPDVATTVPAAIRVRVFSERDWALKLIVTSSLRILDRQEPVPLSRLSWRSRLSGGFVTLTEDRPATIARGSRTDGAGQPVTVDLRLRLGPADEIGRYGCDIRLLLDDM